MQRTENVELLWRIGEIGEVIDIVKKHGDIKASSETGIYCQV